jgi:hypothetical protein
VGSVALIELDEVRGAERGRRREARRWNGDVLEEEEEPVFGKMLRSNRVRMKVM